jgi:hypothetical protein
VIATTSHPELPIADSELQLSPADPVIHDHYVIIRTDELFSFYYCNYFRIIL